MAHGYTDTPIIPGQKWRVHDDARPQAPVITPGDASTKAAVSPPSDAIVLFDGSSFDAWESKNEGQDIEWVIEGDEMVVKPKTGNILTKQHFGSCQLHVEWAAPTEIEGVSQGRGNSGVFLHSMYEVQVLDCYDNPTYADGQAAALYGQFPPLVNACCKPGEWHIYDILWTAPVWENGELKEAAYITVLHNGVVVHNHQRLNGPTGHKNVPEYAEHGPGAIMLQDHSNPVRFRNIWVREL